MREIINCPICNANANVLYKLNKQSILGKLAAYFDVAIGQDLDIVDYEMAACSNCSFTFANPLLEGSGNFYSWITKQKDYYPVDRWEYHKVIELVKSKNKNTALLDVGCGSGEFLQRLNSQVKIKSAGVDTTQTSIDECTKRGVLGYCMDLDAFLSKYPENKNSFDYVVSFHCLEHIGNPLAFVKSMLLATKDNGSLLISTPYSPMSFEVDWFDPLNHPPHHMGRWNERSYRELAKQLNLGITFHMPAPYSVFSRAKVALLFSKLGFKRRYSRFEILKCMASNPVAFYQHIQKQRERDRVNGKVAAEVVLVELKRL